MGVMESSSPLICWQRNGWGDKPMPDTVVNSRCSVHTNPHFQLFFSDKSVWRGGKLM